MGDSGYTLENASQNPFHTPKLSPTPSFSVNKSSRRAELRVQIAELQRKIAQTETQIVSIGSDVENLETQKNEYEVKASQSNDFRILEFATSVSQEIVPCRALRVEKQQFLNRLYDRLSEVEKKLTKAEEEAAKRARASIAAMQTPVLSTEGPDIAYIADNAKFICIQTWLHQERVLLLRSPPGTGKTTFAGAFAKYLTDNGFGATYLNASVPENTPSAMRSMDDIWKATFESELTFSETVPPKGLHYIIIDESQTWYPYNIDDPIGRQEVKGFWVAVKSHIQPATNYLNIPPTGIRLLCLAGYGETNAGSIATLLGFQDPEDQVTNCRQPLGLAFLRLDRESTNKLVEKFMEVKASQGKKTTFDSDVCDLIYEETNGHVGAIRALLHHLVSSDRRSKQHVLDFVRRDIYQTDLSAFRAFRSVSQAVIGHLSAKDVRLLIKSIVDFKKGFREFQVNQPQIVELVKLGLFVKVAATGVNDETKVAFPSLLHFDLLLHNILHRPLDLYQSRDCFECLLKELVLRMSPKALQDTVTHSERVPLENHWQGEVCRSFRTILNTVQLKTSVGREFNERAFLDLYVDDGLQWGIELIRDGSRERLEEHVGRFRNPDGQYCGIPMRQYAVLNFTCYQPNVATLDRYDENVYHLVYNSVYTEVTVYRKGRVADNWNLIGYDGRTEY